jgi:hypothetical protein
VILPKELAKTLPKARLLSEQEWRGIGVQQSRGWGHYAIHRYELTFVIVWFFIELFLNSQSYFLLIADLSLTFSFSVDLLELIQ